MNPASEVGYEAERDHRPLSEIIGNIANSLQIIFREEMRLARRELKDKVRQSKRAGVLLGAAAGMGIFAAAGLIATCIALLALVLPVWLSILVMTALLAIGAGGAFVFGRAALDEVDPVPHQTAETMRDNVHWIRRRVS